MFISGCGTLGRGVRLKWRHARVVNDLCDLGKCGKIRIRGRELRVSGCQLRMEAKLGKSAAAP